MASSHWAWLGVCLSGWLGACDAGVARSTGAGAPDGAAPSAQTDGEAGVAAAPRNPTVAPEPPKAESSLDASVAAPVLAPLDAGTLSPALKLDAAPRPPALLARDARAPTLPPLPTPNDAGLADSGPADSGPVDSGLADPGLLDSAASPTQTEPSTSDAGPALGPSWRALPALPDAARGPVVVELNGTLWAFGGTVGWEVHLPAEAQNRHARSLSLGASAWVQRALMPVGAFVLAAERVGDRVLVQTGANAGGVVNVLEAYTPEDDSWVELTPMPTTRYGFVTAVVDELLYVIGGASAYGLQGEVEVYDLASDSWSTAAPEPAPSFGAASCTWGTRIFVFGGEYSNRTTIYDAASNSWSEATPPPVHRYGHSCLVLGGVMHLLGGLSSEREGLDLVEAYDPEADTWSELPPMPEARVWFGATVANGAGYLVGGLGPEGRLDSVREYRPE